MDTYILALDQGTTSSRAIIFDREGSVISSSQKEFPQYFPKPGWIEHDPLEILDVQIATAHDTLAKAGIGADRIAAVGITNQRETTVVWDRFTGTPIYNAIVWQDRRTASFCDMLKKKGYEALIRDSSGLVADAYFSGPKVRWILENVKGAFKKAEAGDLIFGTIDSWLVWNLTGGEMHITDVSNASRTMLYNINTTCWDETLLSLMDIPRSMVPEVRSSSEVYGYTKQGLFGTPIPIGGIAGDQQAALFGQMCTKKGMIKNTYGTGSFAVMNTGAERVVSRNNLLSTIAWQIDGKTTYALEGSIFVAGAVVQWLRDGLGLVKHSADVEALAGSVKDNGGVYMVPAFTGLGAPHWDQYARGLIIGITRGTESGHIARAGLEGIAFQVRDVINAMSDDAGIQAEELRVDGGAAANDLLLQFQADILDIPVLRPVTLETTALGAAFLAGLSVGYWKGFDEIASYWKKDTVFHAEMSRNHADNLCTNWARALKRAGKWME
ncbi:MAG: glycerol kinase GlpK [Syntrophales bacterium]|nr:glycerol kinase GlpK [Syntrophales bacterium]MDY0043204.1 glycerol kinase GlpK [Syntrophales bacterium]